MEEAQTGMEEMPALKPIDDDGESEDVVDLPEDGEGAVDEGDTADDDD